MAQTIAFYGKGGTGKTTIAANLAAALAETGHRVLLVGCSPTADSSHLLVGEALPRTLFSVLDAGEKPLAEEIVTVGYGGIGCIEAGESPEGESCASRSVAAALKLLQELALIEKFGPEYVIYDMPGDLGCIGEMLQTLRIDLSLVVTSADFQSLYAANRLVGLLARLPQPGNLALVSNGSISSFEDSFVADFAGQVGLGVAATIPRSLTVRHSELYGKTVIEAGPLSTHAYTYRKLARLVSGGGGRGAAGVTAAPLAAGRLKEWAHDWGKRRGELEFGIIQDGAGI
jgi:nitrogenase iron protein NifH